jgi:hypothetical protein
LRNERESLSVHGSLVGMLPASFESMEFHALDEHGV